MTKFYLLMQHLNNISPDIIVEATKGYVPITEYSQRLKVVGVITNIARANSRIKVVNQFSKSYLLGNTIVFEINTADLDYSGRRTYITGYIRDFNLDSVSDWEAVSNHIREFAEKNQLTVTEEAIEALYEGIKMTFSEKKKRLQQRKMIYVGAVLIASVAISYMTFRGCRKPSDDASVEEQNKKTELGQQEGSVMTDVNESREEQNTETSLNTKEHNNIRQNEMSEPDSTKYTGEKNEKSKHNSKQSK